MSSNIKQLLESDTGKLVKRAVRPLGRFVKGLESGSLDLFAPERMVDRFFRRVELLVASIPTDLIRAGITTMVHDDAFWNPRAIRSGLTPKVRAFCDFFRSVDAQWPFASNMLILGSRYLRRGFLVDYLRAAGQIQRATASRREHRAEWLRLATAIIVESLYYELVSIVYAAECLKNGEAIDRPRGGYQLRRIAQATSATLPGLFSGDEGRLRNAAVHYDRWRYDSATNMILLTDTNWSAEYSTSELLAEAREMLEDVALPMHVLVRLHGFESRPVFKLLFSDSASPQLASLGQDYQRTADELRRLGWRPHTDAVVRR